MSEPERLHKFLARCGVASRRKAEDLIRLGHVEVNGETVTELGTKVSEADEVRVNGQPVHSERLAYILMNKPKGVITTLSDERGRKTVMDLLPSLESKVKPVGRLDLQTDGLLLFTNDGELASRMTHARYGIEKEYIVRVSGQILPDKVAKLRSGVWIEGGKTAPATVEVGFARTEESQLRIILHEGRNRQIRKMCEAVGHKVISLRRERIAFLRLKGMRPGECRRLGQLEVERLRKLVGLSQ